MKNITKRYGETTVLSDVSLSVRPGEIHALLGENGAGKSTLMNVLFGMPVIHSTGGFDGEVLIDGAKANILTPNDAMNAGIGMVHQEFMLLPGFTITENIKLNREITRPTILSKLLHIKSWKPRHARHAQGRPQGARQRGHEPGRKYAGQGPARGLHAVCRDRPRDRQKGIRLLVFDEPTAVLTESEAETLISVMKQIARSGIAIIFITHRLDEVMAAADNITILRDGKLAATRETGKTSLVELAELMIGRKGEAVVTTTPKAENKDANIALSIKDLIVDMPGEEVKGVNLEVREGEILGVGGLAGQGKIGIPNGIMGLYPAAGDGDALCQPLPLNDAENALKSGMAMVSEDRRGVGLLLDQSIEDNIAFNAMQINGGFLHKIAFITTKDSRKVREHANKMIQDLDIRCTSSRQAAGTLSGGNQQKVCVARALTMNPKFLFVSEPTRGIDIGAKKLVLETLVRLNREQGMTIVMVSSELQELRSISDRIAIVSEGKVVDILAPDASDADFGLAMSGIKPTKGGEGAYE